MKQVKHLFLVLLSIGFLSSCTSNLPDTVEVPKVQLKEYETIVSYKEGKLVTPLLLKYDSDSTLFVYDNGKYQVLQLTKEGKVLNTFGGQGRGPGEFLFVNNMSASDKKVCVVDRLQYRITSFNKDGTLEQTFNYGSDSKAVPPMAPRNNNPRSLDLDNQPIVTLNGDILLSNIKPKEDVDALYSLTDWKENKIANLGPVPKGSAFILDYDRYQESVSEGEVPAYYKPKAFVVNDKANPGQFYLVYSVLSKIIKYDASGNKLWETEVPETKEMDALTTKFFEKSKELRGKERIGLDKYRSGTTTNEGELYLVLGTPYGGSNTLWIHRFNEKGELIKRYKIYSEEIGLTSIFEVDPDDQRLYVVTKQGDIRGYDLKEREG